MCVRKKNTHSTVEEYWHMLGICRMIFDCTVNISNLVEEQASSWKESMAFSIPMDLSGLCLLWISRSVLARVCSLPSGVMTFKHRRKCGEQRAIRDEYQARTRAMPTHTQALFFSPFPSHSLTHAHAHAGWHTLVLSLLCLSVYFFPKSSLSSHVPYSALHDAVIYVTD